MNYEYKKKKLKVPVIDLDLFESIRGKDKKFFLDFRERYHQEEDNIFKINKEKKNVDPKINNHDF